MTSQVNAKMIGDLSAWFLRNNNPAVSLGMIDDLYKSLPGLRGYWPCTSVGASGELVDMSGNSLHLTNVSSSVFGVSNLASYVEYDGSADYHNRADTSAFDVLGTEAYIESPGLTIGAWVLPTTTSGNEWIISKNDAATNANSSYYLLKNGSNWQLALNSGTNADSTTTSGGVDVENWQLVIGRFIPSVSIDVILNDEKTTSGTAFSSINNSTAPFNISGRNNGNGLFDGKISRPFICASAVSDDYLFALYEMSRVLYGV